MVSELFGLTLSEVSLVDDPDNDEARVVITKARRNDFAMVKAVEAIAGALEDLSDEIVAKALAGGYPADTEAVPEAAEAIKEIIMDLAQLTKALQDAQAENATLQKAKETAEADLAKARADVAAKDAEIAKAKGATQPEPTEEEILKSLPEAIQKRIRDQDAEIAKARAAAEKAEADEYIAKARALKAGDAEKVGALLHRVAKGKTTAEDAALVETVLKQAAATTAASELFKSLGSPATEGASPEEQLVQKAKALQAADPKLTDAAAYSLALDQSPALYDEYIAKRR